MKPTITEVREFGPDAWQVECVRPNGWRFFRIKNRKDCPDELAAYTTVLKELEEEERTNGSGRSS
jgi:hypothetical protein